MAIYHCSIKIISRGKGKSAVAAAAYRAGEKITNVYDGITHDYTRKGGVVHTEILLPEHAPRDYSDRSVLWNAVERIEKNKNSQLAREIELALPVELSREQNISLAREYVKEHFVTMGMCADVCIHDKNDGNPHAHIMLTLRPFEPDGSWGAKSKKEYILDKNGERILLPSGEFKTRKIDTMDWNEQTKAEEWRAGWADAVNNALERQGVEGRVDHRSYERQGVERIPTVHLGVAATQMERKGIRTDRGNLNRAIEVTNSQLQQLKARITKLQNWLKEEAANTAPPTLVDVIQGILESGEQRNRYGQIHDLKTAAKVLDFLTSNHITDMAGLEKKVKSMYGKQDDIRVRLKPVERRLKTLDEHIRQAGYYQAHKEIYAQYRQIKRPKKQAAFYDQHHTEIALYEAAERYLKGVLNGRTTLPVKAWKAERDNLIAERNGLYGQYATLKEEVVEVEKIKWTVYNLMREEARRAKPERDRSMDR